jgi:hypothetical protein
LWSGLWLTCFEYRASKEAEFLLRIDVEVLLYGVAYGHVFFSNEWAVCFIERLVIKDRIANIPTLPYLSHL